MKGDDDCRCRKYGKRVSLPDAMLSALNSNTANREYKRKQEPAQQASSHLEQVLEESGPRWNAIDASFERELQRARPLSMDRAEQLTSMTRKRLAVLLRSSTVSCDIVRANMHEREQDSV